MNGPLAILLTLSIQDNQRNKKLLLNLVGRAKGLYHHLTVKVIIEKSRGEVSPMGQDTIENVS